MKVTAQLYRPSRDDGVVENYSRRYAANEGLTIIERMSTQSKSDFTDTVVQRISRDNGRTWSDFEAVESKTDESRNQGIHQLTNISGPSVYNSVHGHTVSFGGNRIWKDGSDAAAKKYWSGDSRFMPIHSFITVEDGDGVKYTELVKYQSGNDFDPSNWLDPEFFFRNVCLVHGSIEVTNDGDILFTAEVPMRACCEMLGRDINDYFPSAPDFPCGIVLMRGHFDGRRYELTCGRPIVIDEKRSTRGFNEPAMTMLENGRIVVITRGSNAKMSWYGEDFVKMDGHKWYAYSDDGGKTFSEPIPWRYDDGTIIHSSATCARIVRDPKTGRRYWIGNITSPEVDGNFPRYPLCMVELERTTGLAVKSSFTIIDTKREGEPERIQLSNFNLLQNRETGELEVMLSKIGQYPENVFKADVWRYRIAFD